MCPGSAGAWPPSGEYPSAQNATGYANVSLMTYLSKGLTKPSFSNSKMSSHVTESGRDKYCEHPVSPARQAGGQLNRTREQG